MTDREQRAREVLARTVREMGRPELADTIARGTVREWTKSAFAIAAIIAAQDAAYDEAAKVARGRQRSARAWQEHTRKDDPDWIRFQAAESECANIATAIEALKERT